MSPEEYIKKYYEYLQSDWWHKTRDRIIGQYNNQCFCCNKKHELQVHHLSYEHVGFERDNELICLCSECHEWIEDKKEKYKQLNIDYMSASIQRHLIEERKIYLRDTQSMSSNSDGKTAISIFTASKLFIEDMVEKKYDLSAHGKYNLTNMDVIRNVFSEWCDDRKIICDKPAITEIQNYFRNRRYEIILQFIEGGYPQSICYNRTLFSRNMIAKVYSNPDSARMLLAEEKNN